MISSSTDNKDIILFFKAENKIKLHLPEPPHVPVLIREKTVCIITAIFNIVKSTTVDGSGSIPWFRTGERVHEHPVSAVVTAAFSAHVATERRGKKKMKKRKKHLMSGWRIRRGMFLRGSAPRG